MDNEVTVVTLWLLGRSNGWQLDQFCGALARHTGVAMVQDKLQERYIGYCQHVFERQQLESLERVFNRPPERPTASPLLRMPANPDPTSPSSDILYESMSPRAKEPRKRYHFIACLIVAVILSGFSLTIFQKNVYKTTELPLPDGMQHLYPLCLLSCLLLLGLLIRSNSDFCRRCFLPSSVLGGVAGCIITNTAKAVFKSHNETSVQTIEDLVEYWWAIPLICMDIVFSTLFIGQHVPNLPLIWQTCSLQLAYGQILAWGQYVVGLSFGTLFGYYLFPPKEKLFGVILPIGFEGGHGTGTGMIQLFEAVGWREGVDYCAASSTIGLLTGLFGGISLINWYRRFKVPTKPPPVDILNAIHSAQENNTECLMDPFAAVREQDRRRREAKDAMRMSFFEHPTDGPETRPHAGVEVVSGVAVDNLAYHIAMVMFAVSWGYSLKAILMCFDNGVGRLLHTGGGIFRTLPTFPFSMIGGMLIQITMQRSGHTHMVDKRTISHISALALDFLVVASIASIRIDVLVDGLAPFFLLMLFGIIWQVFMCLVVAPRVFFDSWFERAVVEMGQSCGVTATGLLLLKFLDPDGVSPAFAAFALKQILHEPFMGGGIWTSIAVPLTDALGPFPVLAICVGMVIFWVLLIKFYLRPSQRPDAAAEGLGQRIGVTL